MPSTSLPAIAILLLGLVPGLAAPAVAQVDYEDLNPEPDAYAPPVPIPEGLADDPAVRDRPDVPPNVYRAFIGRPVLTEDGRTVGIVANFVFDTARDEVTAMLVALGEEGRLVALPWEAVGVDTRNNVLVADLTLSELAELPAFDPETLASPGYEALDDPS
ncbi:PRC-barrel domain-containing protein [Arenibaculum sp.]|jgi:sporulation protein YlmC with PRC-barrel domain|uniref:PRC-barrel domain-containing protein n=1 Tax=Arenibaculum sp. TaxID=2865862 RepID=UPI002E116F1E|nr:PRC-barrel domain-containing protein [Arenibaculum sp.]